MEDKQMLELILSEIREMKSEIKDIKSTQEVLVQKVNGIETTLEIHTQKINGITEQLAKVSELEPVIRKLVKDVVKLETDVILIKRLLAN